MITSVCNRNVTSRKFISLVIPCNLFPDYQRLIEPIIAAG
jgi:hypothetical protein